MELWIRSQDKMKLLKVDQLLIHKEESDTELPFYILDPYNLLGAYKTKERALEVLEDINAYKDAMHMLELSDSSNISILIKEIMARTDTFTYLMPKE